MDQELRAYLDEREARMDERFSQMEGRMDERFKQVEGRMDERFSQMEGRMNERFSQVEGRMDERFSQVDERFSQVGERFSQVEGRMDERFEQVETEVRHTRVLVEGLNSNIRLLAEAVIGTNERIDFFRADTTASFEEIKGRVGMIQETLVPRVKTLENKVEQENLDVLEVIREKFGIRQAP